MTRHEKHHVGTACNIAFPIIGTLQPARYPRHRFPAEIISHAGWLHHVSSLSLRNVELILAERDIVVTHESIRLWCLEFRADFARRLHRRRPKPGDTWHLDRVFIRPRCVLHYLWRAMNQHNVVPAIRVPDRRNSAAAKRFFKCLLRVGYDTSLGTSSPTACAAYGVAQRAILPDVRHRTSRYFNNRAEKFASTYATTRATDAEIQIARIDAGVSVDARHDLGSLPATVPSYVCNWLPMCSAKGTSDLVTGDLSPAVGVTPCGHMEIAFTRPRVSKLAMSLETMHADAAVVALECGDLELNVAGGLVKTEEMVDPPRYIGGSESAPLSQRRAAEHAARKARWRDERQHCRAVSTGCE